MSNNFKQLQPTTPKRRKNGWLAGSFFYSLTLPKFHFNSLIYNSFLPASMYSLKFLAANHFFRNSLIFNETLLPKLVPKLFGACHLAGKMPIPSSFYVLALFSVLQSA
jgi:hypothetical protein